MSDDKIQQAICDELDSLYNLTKRLYAYASGDLKSLVAELQRQLFVKRQKILKAIADNVEAGGA